MAGLNYSLWDAWPSPRVVWACLSLPEYLLECLGLSFECGRVEVDGDVMVARLVRFAFKAPAEASHLHGCQLLSPSNVEIRLSACVSGLARAVCLGPRTSRSRTCRARQRLVV
jgi:hypothetical protein